VGVLVVAGVDREPFSFVERGGARKQGRGVPVGAEPEVHERERGRVPEELVVVVGRLVGGGTRVVEGVDGAGLDRVEERGAGHALVRVRVVDGDPPFVTEVDVDLLPFDVRGGEQLVAGPGGVTPGQREGQGGLVSDELGERQRHVRDAPLLAGEGHGTRHVSPHSAGSSPASSGPQVPAG
jgi:hypothetical protein